MSITLPTAFAERLQQQLGPEGFAAYAHALSEQAPVSIRINPAKASHALTLERVPWSQYGYYLPERPPFTLDPLLHAGVYYVQEASSMFLEQAILQAIPQGQPLRVLDLCGAPGGKSTHLASLLPPDSLLVSNEVIRTRANILAENLQKWGLPNVVVTNNDPRDFRQLPGFFDVVVMDAPCSGEGLFRKDPDAMDEWSEANVKLCAERQRRIAMEVWEALRPGGTLIYSTCTYNSAENEENLAWLSESVEAQPVQLQLTAAWNVEERQLGSIIGYQFYPHRVRGEGLFLAVLQKQGDEQGLPVQKLKKPALATPSKQTRELLKNWLLPDHDLEFISLKPNEISAFPQHWLPEAEFLVQKLRVLAAGTEVAEVIRNEVKPMHALALSTLVNRSEFAQADVDLETALQFLRKMDILLPNSPKGWVLITYKDQPIGWVKNMGNRTNNYYPKEWRIRMEIPAGLPQTQFPMLQ